MRRWVRRFAFASILTAAPAVWAADNSALTGDEFRAAYCYGYHDAVEAYLGDTCIEAAAGWENACSLHTRAKDRALASLTAGQSMSKPGIGPAITSGQDDYRQCVSEESSDAGVAQTLECTKHYTGQQRAACIASGPAAPTCEKLRKCDE